MAKEIQHISQEEWRAALRNTLLIEQAPDDATREKLYERAVELFTAPGGIAAECLSHMTPLPKVHFYAGAMPAGQKGHDEDGRTLHITFGSKTDETLKTQLFDLFEYSPSYLDNVRIVKADGTRYDLHIGKRIDQDRSKDQPQTLNRASTRSRGIYEPDEIPDHTLAFLNTKQQLDDWKWEYEEHLKFKEKYPNTLSVWELYQRNMFTDEIMQRFSGTIDFTKTDGKEMKGFPLWKDWIRGLRVMNGLSTEAISGLLGYSDSNGFSNIELRLRDHVSHELALKILGDNVFKLPTVEMDGQKIVHPICAEKFCRMVECGKILYAEPVKRKFFKEIESLSDDYISGKITFKEMPAINELLPIFDGLVKARPPYLSVDKLKDYFQLDGKDYSVFFKRLPYINERTHEIQPSFALSKDDAYNLAKNTSTYIGEFLKTYSESIGQSAEAVARNWGCDPKNIARRQAAQKIRSATLGEILSTQNPYRLPVDDTGAIRHEVANFVRQINTEGVKQNPAWNKQAWINVDDLPLPASPQAENPGQPVEGSAQWVRQIVKGETDKLKMREVSSVELGGTVIHCRRTKGPRVQISRDDWPKLKEVIDKFGSQRQ